MRIDWEESTPIENMLHRHAPLRGLFPGEGGLPGKAFFSSDIDGSHLPSREAANPALCRILEDCQRREGASGKSLLSMKLLAGGARAVVTGQQTGLMGGPLLTLLKALTAIRIARTLTARFGEPFVPLFWAEAEDHDIEEVNQTTTLTPPSESLRFSLPCPEEFRSGPAGRIPPGQDGARIVEEFFAASGETEFTNRLRGQVLDDLKGAPFLSRWFSRWMVRLLGDEGLIVLDSSEGGIKSLARPFWENVLEDPLALTEIVRKEGQDIAAAGYKPVLFKERRRCPFFLIDGGKRLPVSFEKGNFLVGEKHLTPLEMGRRLNDHPEDFSPAVNLRPLLQDWLIPTAAYVGGPTELGYHLQIRPGYDWAKIPPPALVLRAGLTLVEQPVKKILSQHGLKAAELRTGIQDTFNRLVRKENHLGDQERWKRLRERTAQPLKEFAGDLSPSDGEIATLAGKTGGKMDYLLRELEKKTVARLQRRSETLKAQLLRTRARLYPEGKLQERSLSPLYFMNKYGPDFVGSLLRDLPGDFTGHFFGTIIP